MPKDPETQMPFASRAASPIRKSEMSSNQIPMSRVAVLAP